MTGFMLESAGDHSTDPFQEQDNVVLCPNCNGYGITDLYIVDLFRYWKYKVCGWCNGKGFINNARVKESQDGK